MDYKSEIIKLLDSCDNAILKIVYEILIRV